MGWSSGRRETTKVVPPNHNYRTPNLKVGENERLSSYKVSKAAV